MKKLKTWQKIIVLTLLMAIFVTSTFGSDLVFELRQVFYPIYANGYEVPQDDLPVLNYNGSTYVPLRKLSEAAGVYVEWDDETKSVYVDNLDSTRLSFAKLYVYTADIYNELYLNDAGIKELLDTLYLCYESVNNQSDEASSHLKSATSLLKDIKSLETAIQNVSDGINSYINAWSITDSLMINAVLKSQYLSSFISNANLLTDALKIANTSNKKTDTSTSKLSNDYSEKAAALNAQYYKDLNALNERLAQQVLSNSGYATEARKKLKEQLDADIESLKEQYSSSSSSSGGNNVDISDCFVILEELDTYYKFISENNYTDYCNSISAALTQ